MSGETALSRQLRKLAEPQTSLLFQDKIKKSLLFDHREAAALDRDVFFSYGFNGFSKLKAVHPPFEKFENVLFDPAYVTFQRSVQNASFNKSLDEKIIEFLRTISPYFLLQSSLEALEWLVYRFQIHEYNADHLIISVLPHYNTSTFVRVVQLLSLDTPHHRWSWLKEVQKSGVHLEYGAVLNRFCTDGEFRKLVCDMAPNSFHVFKDLPFVASPVISFSMVTILNSLGRNKKIDDADLAYFLPYILKGLKSKFIKYVAGSYMVISKITSTVQLKKDLVNSILVKVFENISSDLSETAFKLLVTIFQRQGLKTVNKDLFNLLLFLEDFDTQLIYWSSNCNCQSLFDAILNVSVTAVLDERFRDSSSEMCQKLSEFVPKVIDSVLLSETTVLHCFNSILNWYSDVSATNSVKSKTFISRKRIIQDILRHIQAKYPRLFDEAASQYFKKGDNNRLMDLVNTSISNVKNNIIPNINTTLVLGINHADPEVRKSSIKYLFKLTMSGKMNDLDFIERSIYDRLLDDVPMVVQQAVQSPVVLFEFVDKKKILVGFRHIFQQTIDKNSPWYEIQMTCLNLISKYLSKDEDLMYEILLTVLPFIFPLKEACIKGFKRLINSQLKEILPVFQAIDSSDLAHIDLESNINEKQLVELNFIMFASARKYVERLDDASKSTFTSCLSMFKKNDCSSEYLTLFVYVIGQAIISFPCLEQKVECLRHLLDYLKSSSCYKHTVKDVSSISIDEKALSEHCVESLSKERFPVLIIYHTLNRIVKLVQLQYDPIFTAHWSMKENNSLLASFDILSMLFEFCVEPISSHKQKNRNIFDNILNNFITSQFKSTEYFYAFLSLLWSNALSNVPENLQSAALITASSSCKDSISSDSFFDNYAPCICLFKAVASENTEIRMSALTLLSTLLEKSVSSNSPLKCFAEEINGSLQEISVDHLQFFNVFNSWISAVADIYGQPNYETVRDSDASKELWKKYAILDNFVKVLTNESTVSSIKSFILQALCKTDSVRILTAYLPLINQFLQAEEQLDKSSIEIFGLLIKKYTPKTASSLKEKSAETDTIFHCLRTVGGEKNVKIQAHILKILTRDFFSAIPSVSVQKRLLKELLNSYVTSSSEASVDLKKVLKKLCTFVYLILKDIQEKDEPEKKVTTLREVKKSRTAESSVNVNDSMMWKKITVMLEMIQGKAKLEKREVLVPELFNLLGKAINLDSHSSAEYVKQLILSSIYNCCQYLSNGGLDERQFQVELIVQCIRSSTNPKTHHQALLLLNLAATIFPEYVLNNVMSIFTFMGSSLIRQDDKYSIQVISQTIETIVPSLLAASDSKEENDAMQIVASMIRVFVDSLPDIPKHRQFPLFIKLITTLEPSKYLWIPIAQICDQYDVVFQCMLTESMYPTKLSTTLEFAVNFHQQFSPSVQIDTCIHMLHFLSQLPDFKEENADYSNFTEPFNVTSHTNKQLQKYKHNIVSYINIWLSSQTFIDQVSDLDSKSQQNLEEKYELLLEKALHILQHQREMKTFTDEDKKISLFSLLYDLVGFINALLPCTLFIRVVRRLLQNQEPVIKKKAIELLNTKLEQQQNMFSEENYGHLLKLLKPLIKVAKGLEENDEHEAVNQQTALYALHLLTKIIGSEYPKKFQKVLNLTIHILRDKNEQELRVNALLCLAQLCVSLNVQVLPHLNTFMPIILDLLANFQTIDIDDCLLLGVITSLQSLVENLGMFLSIYLQSLVSGVSILYNKYAVASKSIIQEKLLALQTLLAKDISLRILLPALEDSYSTLCSQDPSAVVPLMNLLEKKLGVSSVDVVESSSSQLQTFFILLLSFRGTHSGSLVETVETSIIAALKSFVVKLSVTRFKLFFQKIYQWMSASELKDSQTAWFHVFTFYNLTNELSKTLKTLFNPAAKHFLKHAATQLDVQNTSKNSEIISAKNPTMITELLRNIIDTLSICFVHDDGLLLDKDSFESLMLPLVDQLENLQGGEAAYQDRVTNHLNTCIAHFMAAVSDNTLWKKLNYQVLMKTRHDLAVVRFAAIRAVREVAVVMGDNYLVLLPESIPFLAEVMEDESTEVEHECQTVIEEMEKILGEPIRKYF